jgi:two-component system, response regulator
MDERVIVLVEDNANDEELMVRAFRKSNIVNRVVVLRDGADALDYFFARGAYADRSPGETAQVVLLDLKLPKVDGHEVLRTLRADARTKLIPIVVLTSSVEEQDMVRSYCLGANSYVRKPIDFTQFVEAVRQLGLYWLVINRAAPP